MKTVIFDESTRSNIFERLSSLSLTVNHLHGIVQNSIPISSDDMSEWSDIIKRTKNSLDEIEASLYKEFVLKYTNK